MTEKVIAACQECDWDGALDGDSCPACGSFIYADISLIKFRRLQAQMSEQRKEIGSLRMSVTIPHGNLVASKSENTGYSGISIYLDDEIIAAVEYDEENGLRVFTYGDMTDDEPTHIVKVKNIEVQLSKHEE